MALISFVIRRLNFGLTDTNSSVNRIARPQRAVLRQVGPDSPGRVFSFPYGPQGVQFGGDSLEYETTDRPGIKPILTAVNKQLRSVTINARLANKPSQGKDSIENQIAELQAMSGEPHDCTFTYGVVALPYRVRITNISFIAIQRNPDGNITQADVSFELQESVVPNQSVVTLTAITYDPPPKPGDSTKTGEPTSDKKESTDTGGTTAIYIPSDPNGNPVYAPPGYTAYT